MSFSVCISIDIRIQGKKEPIEYLDANVDHLWRKSHEADLIRQMEESFHEQKLREPLPKKSPLKAPTDDQRRFQRNHVSVQCCFLVGTKEYGQGPLGALLKKDGTLAFGGNIFGG